MSFPAYPSPPQKNNWIIFALIPILLLPGSIYGRPVGSRKVNGTMGPLSGTVAPLAITATAIDITYSFYNGYGLFYTGGVSANATGGTGPYTYRLSAYTSNNGYFTLLQTGTYTVQVTDATGQTASTTVTVGSIYPLPSLDFGTVVYPSSCNSADGSMTLVGTGGTPPYQYSIDGGVTFTSNPLFSNLTAGVYIFQLKDANGMIAAVQTAPLLIYGSPSIYFYNRNCTFYAYIGGGVPVSCPTRITGELGLGAFYGAAPYSFSLDGINYIPGSPGYGGGSEWNNVPAGLYRGYAKDANGNMATASTSITNFCPVYPNLVVGSASCHQSDGSLTFNPSGGQAPYQYTLDGIHYQSGNTFTGLAPGIYGWTVRDANGLMNSGYMPIGDNCPAVSAVPTAASCNNSDGVLTATATAGQSPFQYSIDGGITYQASNIFNNLAAGPYTVTLKDINGNTATATATVGNNCLQVATSVVTTTCSRSNGSITVTSPNATPPVQYAINGGSFQASNVFPNLSAGGYTISVLDGNGLGASTTATLTDAPGPALRTASTPPSCENTGGTITLAATGGTSPLLYSIDGGISFQTSADFGGLTAGSYTTWVKDANGCSASDAVTLTAPPVPVVSLGADATLCEGATLLLKAPQEVGYSYLWQDNSIADSYTVTAPGAYTVKVTNSNNCSVTGSVNINYQPLPVFTLGPDLSVCTGRTVLLKPVPTPANASYAWSTGNSGSSLVVDKPGLYSLQLTVNGCSQGASVNVGYKPQPVLQLGKDTTLCTGQELLLDATNNNASYVWQDGSVQPVYNVSRAGVYTVKVNEAGCDTSGRITVSYITAPVVDLGSDTTLCITQSLTLNAFYPQSIYEWQDGSTSSSYRVTQAGLYTVRVTNACGPATQAINVSYDNCACRFYVPNAFSPNNDGNNDLFRPKYICLLSGYECKVFNRWGQLVFDTRNPADGWDGTRNGQQQPGGVYVWEIVYKDDLTGKTSRKNGTVVLIR